MSKGVFAAVLVPIRREGWPFIAVFAVVTLGLGTLSSTLGWLGATATLWCVYFFRDPSRVTPTERGLIIAPADGRILSVGPALPPPELDMEPVSRTRISIFMNVFDVHVNRIPIDGAIVKLAYRPGRFLNASLDKASEFNERQAVRIATSDGANIAVVQIAGLVARRILCWLDPGQAVAVGERFGMIRFGSRVDVYLDDGMVPLAVVGQRAVGGETVIARTLAPGENAAPRLGVER